MGLTQQDRDRYLRLLDSALSRGLLGDADYLLRADALLRATSIEQLNRIVQELPLLESPARSNPALGSRRRRTDEQIEPPLTGIPKKGQSQKGQSQKRQPEKRQREKSQPERIQPVEQYTASDDLTTLDPVDVALLMRSMQTPKPPTNHRMTAIAVVTILFLILIVLGVLLALHSHSVSGASGFTPHLVAQFPLVA